MAALLAFLPATPERHATAAYFIDNVENRLHMAERCQQFIEENRLASAAPSAAWAILMVAPESYLNRSRAGILDQFMAGMEALIASTVVLLKACKFI
jgi:hypothetical protein